MSDRPTCADTPVTISEIIRHTAVATSVSYDEIIGPSREPHIYEARALAVFLSREIVHASYPRLGKVFGNRDHTSMMHAVKRGRPLSELSPLGVRVAEYVRSRVREPRLHRAHAVLNLDAARTLCEQGENMDPLSDLGSSAAVQLGSALMAEWANDRTRLRTALRHLETAVEEITLLRRVLAARTEAAEPELRRAEGS